MVGPSIFFLNKPTVCVGYMVNVRESWDLLVGGGLESDLALLRRYAENENAEVFAELVERYAGPVYGTCLRITKNPHDAQDITQQCFAEVPAALVASLGKMALAGIGKGTIATATAAGASAVTGGPLSTAAAKGIAVAAAAALVAGGVLSYKVITHHAQSERQQVAANSAPAIATGEVVAAAEASMTREETGMKAPDYSAEEMEKALGAMTVRRKNDRVWIEGVGRLRFGEERDNQFIAAMTVMLRAMGEAADYDTLMGYSGAAFRLHFWDKELCPSSPDLLGGFNHALSAAEALGYRVEIVRCDGADQKRQRELRQKIAASIDRGVPVIANNLMGHGSYEVIVGYENGGTVLLARAYDDPDDSYSQGRSWPGTLVFVENKRTPLAPRAVTMRSLDIAVELAETASYERDGKQWSGFAAYDRWIAELKKDEEFAKLSAQRSTYLADANGWIYLALADARGAAARYVRKIAGDFDGAAAAHFQAAADRYQQIREKLSAGRRYAPASWQLPGERWSRYVPHPEAPPVAGWTKEMRDGELAVLQECKALEQGAVAEIRAGMDAVRSSRVTREGGKVWIEGVPPLAWGKEQCTFAGSLARASMVTERPCAYDDVMGWSGLAFRVRWYQTKVGRGWCPSSPVGEIPQAMDAAQAATGWQFRHEWHWGDPKMERFAPDIVAAIDGGRPILAYDEGLNVAVICGYADAGKTVLLRQYDGKQDLAVVPTAKLGPMLMFFKEHVAPLPPREALVAGLKIAIHNWRRDAEEHQQKGQYWYGAMGLRTWAADLADAKGLTDEQLKSLFFVSWWNESSMADARAMAVSFLRRHASELPGDGQAALLRAADVYDREGGLFRQAFRDRTAFFSPGTGKTFADWTDAIRQREAKLLLEAGALEDEAITEIGKALAAAGR